MEKICVLNYKGGTGKTCTVVNLAHGIALTGKRVLIIDTDPQGSAAYHLGIHEPERTLYDLMITGLDPKECIINARENLDIICANDRLYAAQIEMARRESQREHILKNALQSLTGYDYVLLDCSPSLNIMNQNVLLYADRVLLPVSTDYLSLVGVKQLLKNLKLLKKIFTSEIYISKVIPTFFDIRNKKSKDVVESLKRVFPGSISSPIRTNVSLSEAPGLKRTIFEYDPKSSGAADYSKLVSEVLVDG